MMVDGVGFLPYVRLFSTLRIPCVVRTDNDVLKTPNKEYYRFAGIQRGIGIYRAIAAIDPATRRPSLDNVLSEQEDLLQGFCDPDTIPPEHEEAAKQISANLEDVDIFIAGQDLEQDLAKSGLSEILRSFTQSSETEELVQRMQKRKATFMFAFLREHESDLAILQDSALAKPLLRCKQIVEDRYGHCAYL